MVAPTFLAGGGEAGALARAVDWAATPLGPPEAWSQALRAAASMVLLCEWPMLLCWGPAQIQIYNDAFVSVLGAKHPRAMGAHLRDCWAEVIDVVGPMLEQPYRGGASWVDDDLALTIDRRVPREEAHFRLACNPVRDEVMPAPGIGGVLIIVTEITAQVYADRQLRTLRALASRAATASTVEHVCAVAADTLGAAAEDVPFMRLYLLDDRNSARLAAQAGEGLALDAWRADELARAGAIAILEALPGVALPVSPWGEAPRQAIALPLASSDPALPHGVLVCGCSPHRVLDDGYRTFFALVAAQVALALRSAHANVIEQRRAEQLAASRVQRVEAEARARLEALVMQAPVAMALYRGPEHVFELANARAQEVIGAGALLGRALGDVLPHGENNALLAAFDRAYQTGEPFVATDFAVQFARGGVLSEHIFQLFFEPMRDPEGAVTGLLTIGVEITELIAARGEAERANRAKDEFLAILGHELRNPLAPILTALEVMRLRDAGAPRELAVVERQAHHLVRLVDDLLDVSRITQGKLALHRRRVELAHVVARAVETATPLLEQRGHQLVVDVDARGLVVDADLDRLAQAVANLLTNAAKYTERGGRVTVSAARRGDEIALVVRDTGIGIARDMLPHVFDMFVQERQALDRASGGLGLGLTIVRSLVGLHGGRIEVASEGRDRGSAFTILLPVADADADRPRALSQPDLRVRSHGRILLVDDNVDAADMLATSLQMLGYDTQAAHDGPEALRLVAGFAPDIAVLDIGLPVMDGYELAGRLRQEPGLDHLRLVALTGYGSESDRQRSRQAGFDAHLVKPVSLDAIRDVLAGLAVE